MKVEVDPQPKKLNIQQWLSKSSHKNVDFQELLNSMFIFLVSSPQFGSIGNISCQRWMKNRNLRLNNLKFG